MFMQLFSLFFYVFSRVFPRFSAVLSTGVLRPLLRGDLCFAPREDVLCSEGVVGLCHWYVAICQIALSTSSLMESERIVIISNILLIIRLLYNYLS